MNDEIKKKLRDLLSFVEEEKSEINNRIKEYENKPRTFVSSFESLKEKERLDLLVLMEKKINTIFCEFLEN